MSTTYSEYTRQDLLAIRAAIKTGQKRVRLNNREVEYQSVDQMITAANYIEEDLANQSLASGTNSRPRAYRGRTRKGL